LIALLIVESNENRHRQAWLIFVPVVVVALVATMATRLLTIPDDAAEWFGIAAMSCALAWAAVWLAGHRLAGSRGFIRFTAALVLMLVVGGLSIVSHLGLDNNDDLLSVSIALAVASTVLLLGMMCAGRLCRDEFRRGKFMRWLFLAMAVLALLPAAVAAILYAILGGFGGFAVVVFVQMSIMGVAVAGILYLLNLPFMLLALSSPFYEARFHAMFCPARCARAALDRAAISGTFDPAMEGPETRGASARKQDA
jgi:hypothetical protein